jgi:SpoVK/Ycf46/Vps4 family AAA+-type ATPase
MVGILSTWVQESKAQVCLAMTANNISSLPVEFTNRMDERFFFDLANEDERISILKIHLKKIGVDSSKYNLANLAEAARLLVGREIEQAIKAAMIDSFAAGAKTLDEAILAKVLRTKPRIVNTMKDEIADVLEWVGYDEEAQDGIRAKLASGRKPESFSLVKGDLPQQKSPWKRYQPSSLPPQTPSTFSWYVRPWKVDLGSGSYSVRLEQG